MNNPARIAHQTGGRVRIEIPGRRGDAAFFATLSEQLRRVERVRRARANPHAASIAIEYAGELAELIPHLTSSSLALDTHAIESPAGGARAATARPAIGNGRRVDPMLVAGAAFGLVGVVQVFRGEIMIPALSAFWYATDALRLIQLPRDTLAPDLP